MTEPQHQEHERADEPEAVSVALDSDFVVQDTDGGASWGTETLPDMPAPDPQDLIRAFKERVQQARREVYEIMSEYTTLRLAFSHAGQLNTVHADHVMATLGSLDFALYTVITSVASTGYEYPHRRVAS